ncbi:hypothetical protein [Rhizobium phaseoli]|uniref:hypothetical protein n=1 Tax=Rhizobium phaseoli TaxID=396 RepID=UPI0007E972D0|nr:hypothetical protein [Rhizobium phaseoli]ANL42411.1 hypothetical protein AMC88_CH04078 [Rhizobium phaseoli]ANL61397.1 hypothetical protein AMC85_CH04075 [Rhizobium phaseoli]
MSKNDIFGSEQRKLKIDEFKPESGEDNNGDLDQRAADRTAERNGFTSRETIERVGRVRKPSEPFDQAYVRAPLATINRFKRYCNETGYSYGEALDVLMRKAGV